MDCEEMLVKQVALSAAASPGTRFFIYRNFIKGKDWCASEGQLDLLAAGATC